MAISATSVYMILVEVTITDVEKVYDINSLPILAGP